MSYSYREDSEYFTGEFDSPEQAAIEAFSLDPSLESIEVGENVMHPTTHYISGQSIVDDMKCAAEDEAGECAEDWLDLATDEQLAQLEALVADWADRVEAPQFWGIGNTHTITRAELIAKGLLQEGAA